MNDKIKHLRQDYSHSILLESHAEKNPIFQFRNWMEDALRAELPEPHAMTISTASETGRLSSRIVLLRNFDADGFVFYTNYASKKAKEGASNKYAALNFFWQQIERQVRIEGRLKKVDEAVSDAYFASRPRESQLGAWASAQSEKLSSREELETKLAFYAQKFQKKLIPRPPHWGGFCLVPDYFEFWQGRESRLHDRIVYQLNKEDWELFRLNP
jgi:pyridoxamine 5'-phosphate oxidase